MFKEIGPQDNVEFEEEVKKWYQEILADLKSGGFEITPTEAVFLRKTIRDVFNQNERIIKDSKKSGKKSMDVMFAYPEIFSRFFSQLYGIDLHAYYKNIKPEDSKKATRDLYEYVQEKLRKDKELI